MRLSSSAQNTQIESQRERARAWSRAELLAYEGWQIDLSTDLIGELKALECWSDTVEEPIDSFELECLALPKIQALASRIQYELDRGYGVVWLRRMPVGSTELAWKLLFIALGLHLGQPVGAYGRLYNVRDTGRSYQNEAIPVSQTRASTGMHTDSSNRGVCPNYIGLLCISDAVMGGDSRISSVLQAHEMLRRTAPKQLALLYEDYIRDLVTPGAVREPETIRQNIFPIFSSPPAPTFRYMRYWIERGHELCDLPLSPESLAAFDLLDSALEHPEHIVHFHLKPGDIFFCDNTQIVHDRKAYVSDPKRPRLLCRLWIARGSSSQS